MKPLSPTIEKILKEIPKLFKWCSEHQATEKVIPGLSEHISIIPQDIQSFLTKRLKKVEEETLKRVENIIVEAFYDTKPEKETTLVLRKIQKSLSHLKRSEE